MRRSLPFLLLLVAACVTTPSVAEERRGPVPLPKEPLPTRPDSFAGTWIEIGSNAPPGPATITDCYPSYRWFVFSANGDVVTVSGAEQWSGGPAKAPWQVFVQGRWSGDRLALAGTETDAGHPGPLHLTLRWDSVSEQFVGTWNARSFRLARLVLDPPPRDQCGPPPQ